MFKLSKKYPWWHYAFNFARKDVVEYLLVYEERVEEEANLALSAFILAVSRRFVSENWVAMTTRHRLIMKNEPI
jgi:hypothetical protein